jgi:prepilin-type N-terminal cleavage/methylation domain-containing protein
MTKRFAFTLAEVLIALAIIGVVAAMTIPTFMANTAGAQFRTGFKKGITVLTQAASTNYATEDYDFAGTNAWYGNASAATTATAGTLTVGERFGFETSDLNADEETNRDMAANAQSLYHIFKNNLNLKNSSEVVNYAVGIPDPALDCAGTATAFAINVPGVASAGTAQGVAASSTDNSLVFNRATYFGTDETASATLHQGGLASLCAGRALSSGNGGINQGRMFMLEDGMVFTYDPAQTACTESHPCYGYIDVNGPTGPNKVISCSPVGGAGAHTNNQNSYIRGYGRNMTASSTNGNSNLLMASCTVEAKDITDIFPVVFYGSTVKPASLAAKAVYYSQKSNQVASGG